jgi:hypothetical protein
MMYIKNSIMNHSLHLLQQPSAHVVYVNSIMKRSLHCLQQPSAHAVHVTAL